MNENLKSSAQLKEIGGKARPIDLRVTTGVFDADDDGEIARSNVSFIGLSTEEKSEWKRSVCFVFLLSMSQITSRTFEPVNETSGNEMSR